MEVNCPDSVVSKQLSGKKKKKLFTKIISQMEFYFSDSNLAKDRFLQNLIQQNPEGYVDLEVFKSFNKLKALTDDTDMISAAIARSNILKVNDDKTKVKRVTPLGEPKDVDACTLYVEKLPSYADHKWIKNVFENFGVVDYVNIPRYKISNKIKGFAFVEFNSPESVSKACEHYKNSVVKQSGESEDENINSKQGKTRKASQLNDDEEKSSKKRKVHSDVDLPTEKNCNLETNDVSKDADKCHLSSGTEKEALSQNTNKKRKHESSESDIPLKKVKDSEQDLKTPEHEDKVQAKQQNSENQSAEKAVDNSEGETEGKSKRKRKHKKKKHETSERPLLRVMSKYEWKSYRNRYLELQRSTMSNIKRMLMLETQEWKEHDLSVKSETVSESTKKGLQFQSGVILKITLENPIENSSEIKDKVKANAAVAYIDAPLGYSELFVRCQNHEEAQTIVIDKKLDKLGSVQLLKGSEEKAYWKKIEEDRKVKFSVPLTHKKRGRDKIISKAAKLAEQKNKHIYFDE